MRDDGNSDRRRGRAAMAEQFSVSHETLERLDRFAALLARWQSVQNLVSKGELHRLWSRHIVDSAQLWGLIAPRLQSAAGTQVTPSVTRPTRPLHPIINDGAAICSELHRPQDVITADPAPLPHMGRPSALPPPPPAPSQRAGLTPLAADPAAAAADHPGQAGPSAADARRPKRQIAWVDLGSGAGFPGLVIAIMAPPTADFIFHLIEANKRKCAFLQTVAAELALPVRVHPVRIEHAGPGLANAADIVSARALAPLGTLCQLAYPLATAKTIFLWPKGRNWQDELTDATKSWTMRCDIAVSCTDESARILVMRDLVPRIVDVGPTA